MKKIAGLHQSSSSSYALVYGCERRVCLRSSKCVASHSYVSIAQIGGNNFFFIRENLF